MSKMCPVIHFEMPARDKKRAKQFYSQAFGWEMQQLGSEMNDYLLATTTPKDGNGQPIAPGAINGGFFQFDSVKQGMNQPILVISVSNIRESMALVKGSGGKIFDEPVMIPDIGQYVAFEDPEGNRCAMLEPKKM